MEYKYPITYKDKVLGIIKTSTGISGTRMIVPVFSDKGYEAIELKVRMNYVMTDTGYNVSFYLCANKKSRRQRKLLKEVYGVKNESIK